MRKSSLDINLIEKMFILLVIFITLTAIIMMASNSNIEEKRIIVPEDERFLVVDSGKIIDLDLDCRYYIVVDNDTGVEYYLSAGKYNTGTLTPLYNSDGTLKTVK